MHVSALLLTTIQFLPVLIISIPEKAFVQKKKPALNLYGVLSLLNEETDFGFKCLNFR